MQRGEIREWYGRRFTIGVEITAFLLIIAFGIIIAFSPGNKEQESDQHYRIEQLFTY